MTGAQLGAVGFLTASLGIGITGTEVRCTVPLGPRHGVQEYLPRQTALLAVSHDGGLGWITQGTVLPITGTGPELLAVASASRVWVASATGQLFGTSDGGLSWQRQLPDLRVLALAAADGTAWLAACPAAASPACSVQVETARAPGWSWQARSASATGGAQLTSARVEPLSATGALLLGGGAEPALLRTSNGGRTWSALKLPPDITGPSQLALGATAGAWFLLVSAGGGGMNHAANAIFRSTDDGHTWTAAAADTSEFGPEPAGAPAPVAASALAAGSGQRVWLAELNELEVSDDGGVSWQDVPNVNLNGTGELAEFDVLNAAHAWLLGWPGGLWRTTDGMHWERM